MRKYLKKLTPVLTAFVFLYASAFFAQFAPPAEAATPAKKPRVVVTIFPQYDFVRQIAGDLVELTMLLRPGSESHSFEPTPQDIMKIRNCDLFIYVGGESDAWVDRILGSMEVQNIKTLRLVDMVHPLTEEIVEGMQADHDHEPHEHDDHDHDAPHHHEDEVYDEHVWTSPKNAQHIVRTIAGALCEIDPANEETYRANAAAYTEKLAALDETFRSVTSGGLRRTLVFGDKFPFLYLAHRYGLTYYAAFPGCSTETEASAATVAFLIDKVREENIPVVFHIELSSGRMADAICESAGAKKALLHSCHNISRDDFQRGVGYLELMERNAAVLREALH